ncbi:hypothetical protein [Halobacterium yunchengense]|uniref:hypothetical protein n=1 Tax=Halobacterium yunchengense TaxID=3108497 RepID=UPI0030090F1B
MTGHLGPLVTLRPRTYRWVDRATKLAGVALVAVGLEVGGATTAGLAFACLGAAVGLATVCIDADDHRHDNP